MTSRFIVCHQAYFDWLKNRCAAELLYFFKQQKGNRDGWFIITLDELRNIFFGAWGKDAIRTALKLLDEWGLVIRRHNRLNGRAWEYKFVTDNPTTVVEEPLTVIDNPTTVVEEPTTTYIQDPIQDQLKDPPKNECVVEAEEEMSEEEIQAAISASLGVVFEPSPQPQEQPAADSADTDCQIKQPKKDLTPFFNRLRAIDVPLSGQIRELLTKKPEDQLSRNIAALEEEAGKNGLKNPIASCIAAITRNWQPRMDAAAWWETAARTWGRERRDSLIQNVSKLFSPSSGREEFFIIYKTGKMLKLSEAYNMNWDELATYGGAV